jgi:O-methyltransferase involved in polyketide biosynthesis
MSFFEDAQKNYEAIIRTNDQAAECRLSAIKAGLVSSNQLLELDYLEKLLKCPKKKQPLINRGTFIRTCWIDEKISEFKDSVDFVIVLGAGFDLRALRFPDLKFYEIDLPEVIHRKQKVIPDYPASLISCDLRYITRSDLEFIRDKSVLVISECVFSYIEKSALQNIASLLFEIAKHTELVAFEPITIPEYQFTCILLQNMDLEMAGLFSSEANVKEFYSPYFSTSFSQTLNNICLSKPYKEILETHGKLDEYEEWNLIGSHYGFFHFTSKEK